MAGCGVAMTTETLCFQVTGFSSLMCLRLFNSLSTCLEFIFIFFFIVLVQVIRGQSSATNEVINCNEFISISQRLNGTIYSMGYPNPYPAKRFCTTQLQGDSKHRVILRFDDFYLHHPLGQHHRKQASCTGLDTLHVYDGLDEDAKMLGEFCGGRKPPQLLSSGPDVSLKLTSYTSGIEARGYAAKYYFVNVCHSQEADRLFSFDTCNGEENEGLCPFEKRDGQNPEDCKELISASHSLNGSIQSNGYPCPYPKNRFCTTQLKGDAKHRVILQFDDFYLSHPLGERHRRPASCSGLDTLHIYDGLEEDGKVLGEYCGGRKPPQLMSSGPHMSLKLTSYASGNDSRGYSAKYYFVSNFGITSGKQKKEGICEFTYDTDKKKEGIITSPNPGGLYPANTNCSYFFDGTFLERVYFKFRFFDLEGIEPCTARSGSDFLEFSSLPGYDPCPSRRCGLFIPQEIVSEGPYFRITFSSNDHLSGLGFASSYKFVTDDQLPDWASYLKSNTAKSSLKTEFSFGGITRIVSFLALSIVLNYC